MIFHMHSYEVHNFYKDVCVCVMWYMKHHPTMRIRMPVLYAGQKSVCVWIHIQKLFTHTLMSTKIYKRNTHPS